MPSYSTNRSYTVDVRRAMFQVASARPPCDAGEQAERHRCPQRAPQQRTGAHCLGGAHDRAYGHLRSRMPVILHLKRRTIEGALSTVMGVVAPLPRYRVTPSL